MNETIFFLQTSGIAVCSFWAYRIGKEALMSFFTLLCVFANFFVIKQMTLFNWNVTCSDAFAVGSILTLNLLQRKYGKKAAYQAITISFFGMVFFAIFSQIHLFYKPSLWDTSQDHFSYLLTWTPRLLIASLTTFFIVQQLDVRLYSFLKKNFLALNWKFRLVISLIISQLLDTALFTLLGLYGIVEHSLDVFIMSYSVKCITICVMTFLVGLQAPLEDQEIHDL